MMKTKSKSIKRIHDINAIQHFEGDTLIVGTDEYGDDFTIVFDSYELFDWIDMEEIKKSIIKKLDAKV